MYGKFLHHNAALSTEVSEMKVTAPGEPAVELWNFQQKGSFSIIIFLFSFTKNFIGPYHHTAIQTELAEHPICYKSTVVSQRRPNNIAILSRHEVEVLTLLKKLPAGKLIDYDNYPLAHRAGIIHSIPKESLSIETATIIEVNFLGLFPKSMLDVLRRYKNNLQ